MRQSARWMIGLITLSALVSLTTWAGDKPSGVVDRFFEAYRSADVDAMLAVYAADAKFEDVSQRHSFQGTEQLRAMLGAIVGLHESMDLEETRRTVDGDTVVVEYVYSGRLNGKALSQISGKEGCPSFDYTLPTTSWYTVRNGRIVAHKDYIDFATYQELQKQILAAAGPGN